ncbi:unnamed protein product [Camellia sinensis]
MKVMEPFLYSSLVGMTFLSYLKKIKAHSLLRDPSKFLVLPLHGSMPTINQCEIFDRPHANVRGMMVEFAKNVADFATASGKKHIVVLSSLDFGRCQTIDMSRYFSSRSLLLVECMSVKNVTNLCFCYSRRMMSKTCKFGLCYFEL